MCTFLRNLGIPVVAFVLLGLSAVGVSGQDAPGTVTITQGGTGQGTVTSTFPAPMEISRGVRPWGSWSRPRSMLSTPTAWARSS